MVIILTVAVLVSLSYLLDFLIAVDFLGCERIKASVEDKILDVFESNGIEVVPADSICLYSTIPR